MACLSPPKFMTGLHSLHRMPCPLVAFPAASPPAASFSNVMTITHGFIPYTWSSSRYPVDRRPLRSMPIVQHPVDEPYRPGTHAAIRYHHRAHHQQIDFYPAAPSAPKGRRLVLIAFFYLAYIRVVTYPVDFPNKLVKLAQPETHSPRIIALRETHDPSSSQRHVASGSRRRSSGFSLYHRPKDGLRCPASELESSNPVVGA